MEKSEILMCLHLSKLSRDGAAQLAGVSRATFYREMRAHGVEAPKSNAKLSAFSVQAIRRARQHGARGRTLAEAFGVSVSTVSRRVFL